jgi:hypothetical protein
MQPQSRLTFEAALFLLLSLWRLTPPINSIPIFDPSRGLISNNGIGQFINEVKDVYFVEEIEINHEGFAFLIY